MISLLEAFLLLDTIDDVSRFFRDICTPKELKEMELRWKIAQTLHEHKMSYRDIAQQMRTSTTTVTRVARCLNDEPHNGYKMLLDRIDNPEK